CLKLHCNVIVMLINLQILAGFLLKMFQIFLKRFLKCRLQAKKVYFCSSTYHQTMLQLNVLREQTDFVVAGLNKKNYKNAAQEVAALVELDQQRRQVQSQHDELQARANSL